MKLYVYKGENSKILKAETIEVEDTTPIEKLLSILSGHGFTFSIYQLKDCLDDRDLSHRNVGELYSENGNRFIGLQIY